MAADRGTVLGPWCVARVAALALVAPTLLAAASPSPAGPAGRWQAIAASPLAARWPDVVAWAGDRLLVWGGFDRTSQFADGATYDPRTGTWRRIAASPLSPRYSTAFAWTGRELILWGGRSCAPSPMSCSSGEELVADGAAYSPASDAWRRMAATSLLTRSGCSFTQLGQGAWTGRRLLVWGAEQCGDAWTSAGAQYDAARDTWLPMAPAPIQPRLDADVTWSGSRMLVWGGFAGGDSPESAASAGAGYDPVADRWQPIPQGPLRPRHAISPVWARGRLFVWGGYALDSGEVFGDGATYDPATASWRTLPASPLSARGYANLVPVGRDVLVWAGTVPDGSGATQQPLDGALYDVDSGTWLAIPPAPVASTGWAVWAGDRVLTWGNPDEGRGAAWIPPPSLLPRASSPAAPIAAFPLTALVLLLLVAGTAWALSRRRRAAAPATAPAGPTGPRGGICPACGRQAGPGARFCGSCGTRLDGGDAGQ